MPREGNIKKTISLPVETHVFLQELMSERQVEKIKAGGNYDLPCNASDILNEAFLLYLEKLKKKKK